MTLATDLGVPGDTTLGDLVKMGKITRRQAAWLAKRQLTHNLRRLDENPFLEAMMNSARHPGQMRVRAKLQALLTEAEDMLRENL